MIGTRQRLYTVLIGAALAAGALSNVSAEEKSAFDPWAQIVPRDAAPADAATDQAPAGQSRAAPTPDVDEPDWTQLDRAPDPSTILRKRMLRAGPVRQGSGDASWTRNDQGNGVSAVSVKSATGPVWDTHIGANMDVVRQTPATSLADSLARDALYGRTPTDSSGRAWASASAPGVPYLWDKTALEVSMDSRTEQGKLGTMLSKSLPLAGDRFQLTLQNSYQVTEQAALPGNPQDGGRSMQIERDARFSVDQTGTSLIAGQTLSPGDDKWRGKVGAEQKLLGDLELSGTVSQAANGALNKSVTAGFKKSW